MLYVLKDTWCACIARPHRALNEGGCEGVINRKTPDVQILRPPPLKFCAVHHSSSADLATGRNGSTERTVEGSNEETTHAATTSAPPTRLRWSRLSPSSRRPKRLAHKGSVATITDASDLSVLRRAGTRRPLMAGPTLVAASHSLPLGPDGTARRPISPAKSSAPAGQGRGYTVTVGVALY